MPRFIIAATLLVATQLSAADIDKLISEGRNLSDGDANRLEDRLTTRPNDTDSHVKLTSYWTYRPEEVPRQDVIVHRARHILWLIDNVPANVIFQWEASRVYLAGPLADQKTFEKGRALWFQRQGVSNGGPAIARNAAQWLRFGDPERAAELLEASDTRTRGYFYGQALLGITALDFQTGQPIECSEASRNSPFARSALKVIEQSQDAAFVSRAAFAFASEAGLLYADGKMDWDYTGVLRRLLDRTLLLDSTTVEPYAFSTDLPMRGQRPPAVLTIGGNVMQKKLIPQSQVPPVYPAAARQSGIEGTVRLNLLIGTDGGIVKMAPASGHPDLIQAAAAAVGKWRYEPTLLNGRPCQVLTMVDVHFTLR